MSGNQVMWMMSWNEEKGEKFSEEIVILDRQSDMLIV
jgi:hypothetical protein